MAKWNLEQLLAAADAVAVAESIGIPIKKAGAVRYIPSFDNPAEQKRFSHNQLFRDGCWDYASNIGRNTYGLVRDYYQNVLGQSLSHDEICEIIAATCGGADLYREAGGTVRKKPFPFSRDVLELIGLSTDCRCVRVPVAYATEFRPDETFEPDDRTFDGWQKCRNIVYSIYKLYDEDPECFWSIACGKLKDALKKTQSIFKSIDGNSPADVALKQELTEDWAKLQDAWKIAQKRQKAS